MIERELKPVYDSAKSFYKKAHFKEHEGIKVLISYDTKVCVIKKGVVEVFGTYSQTTLRHIKEFLKQNGFKADSKAQIEKDYIKEVVV